MPGGGFGKAYELKKRGKKGLLFLPLSGILPHRKQIFKRGTRDRQNRSYRSGVHYAPPYLVVLCRLTARLFLLYKRGSVRLGILRIFSAPPSRFFLEIHKVFLQKNRIGRTKNLSQSALASRILVYMIVLFRFAQERWVRQREAQGADHGRGGDRPRAHAHLPRDQRA